MELNQEASRQAQGNSGRGVVLHRNLLSKQVGWQSEVIHRRRNRTSKQANSLGNLLCRIK